MRIFLRTFNNKINSKTGSPLPEGQYRGSKEWKEFEKLLIDCLRNLNHEVITYPENGLNQEQPDVECDKRIYWHRTKRDEQADLYLMQMHMRELFTIDISGWGADHSENNFHPSIVDVEDAKRFCQEKSDELLSSGISKCDQPKENSETPARFIFVPVQIPRDYTIKHHSPITIRYFLESIQAWAVETENHVCFKMHPHNKGDQDLHQIVDEASANSRYVHKVEGNIHELIKRSSGLFVINSGTGFEGLIHGKPVATFGACDYSRASFNADIRRLDEARNFIYSFKDEWRHIGYQFVYWYWHNHAYDVNRADTKERLTKYLREKL